MIRNAFKMQISPGKAEEYKRRHDEIWPELNELLRQSGISDYTIFLDEETRTLFAVQKLSDDHSADKLPNEPLVRKWWDSMADLMETNPDGSPVCESLVEMYHLD